MMDWPYVLALFRVDYCFTFCQDLYYCSGDFRIQLDGFLRRKSNCTMSKCIAMQAIIFCPGGHFDP
jgi:hypothetical protein